VFRTGQYGHSLQTAKSRVTDKDPSFEDLAPCGKLQTLRIVLFGTEVGS
jgi:hypothetical protein